MGRKASLVLLVAVLLAAPAAASGDVASRKQSIDSRIAALHTRIAAAQHQEDALRSQIGDITDRIRGLDSRVGTVSAQLARAESVLALHQERLDKLTHLFALETQRYLFLRDQYRLALDGLDERLIALYENGEPSTLEVLLDASSFSDAIEQLDYSKRIHREDVSVSHAFRTAKIQAHKARERTRRVRAVVAAETRIVAARTQQVRDVRNQLVAAQSQLASARSRKQTSLAHVSSAVRQEVGEAAALSSVSSQLGSQIAAAQSLGASSSSTPSHVSSSGFIWPVNGPVVSPFGMRWGRMHTGIDIAVGYGTPIHAAASGTVIYATWMSGYGNLVFIDHGGGISTGYAHQSRIAVSNGQHVSQGEVIGYVGCTGHCFGPHLHFEVRVNGTPVDPLGYL